MQTMSKTATSAINWLPEAIQFDLKEFMSEVKRIPFFRPDGNPNKEWHMFYGSTLAEARARATDAAKTGERDKARMMAEVAPRDPSRVAAEIEACETAKNITFLAALNAIQILAAAGDGGAARYVEYGAAQGAARDAVRDASLMARMIVVKDTRFKDKANHIKHASDRMEVWKKGYCLAGVVDGTFYVYCVGRPLAGIDLRVDHGYRFGSSGID